MSKEMPEHCECCHYETTELKAYPKYGSQNKVTTFWFCELCANSLASNVIGYPSAHENSAGFLAGVIMNAANHILAELRRGESSTKG